LNACMPFPFATSCLLFASVDTFEALRANEYENANK